MVGAYHRAFPYTNSLKKMLGNGEFLFFWTIHEVIFKGEDYIMNYIDT
jgi:hypothetical protein